MKKSVAIKWVKALRSGKYKKGIGSLNRISDNSYCCLGVLCDISKKGKWTPEGSYCIGPGWYYDIFLPKSVANWAGMTNAEGGLSAGYRGVRSLVNLNDHVAKSFKMIANYIEKHYKDL